MERANKYYNIADDYARKASHLLDEANNVYNTYLEEKVRLENWKQIMSTTPVRLFAAIFIIVSIVEYLISMKIYEEFSSRTPWIVAIAFFAIGLVVSEFIVYKFSSAKREWKKYEMKRDRNTKDLITPEVESKIQKYTNKRFISGIILGIALVTAIGFLSYKRVQFEIMADLRPENLQFGIMDGMPVILYIVEIISGFYIWYLIKEWNLFIKVKRLKNNFDNIVETVNNFSSKAVDNFHQAEKEGLNLFELTTNISENIHNAFYRTKRLTLDDKARYIKPPEKYIERHHENVVNFSIKNDKGELVKNKNIKLITEYKFTQSGGINDEGNFTAVFEGTFPGDSVRRVCIENGNNKITLEGNWDLDAEVIHTIIVNHQ
jgi:hypothetical protein